MYIKFDRSDGLVQDVSRFLVGEVTEEAQADRISITWSQCGYQGLQFATTFSTFNHQLWLTMPVLVLLEVHILYHFQRDSMLLRSADIVASGVQNHLIQPRAKVDGANERSRIVVQGNKGPLERALH